MGGPGGAVCWLLSSGLRGGGAVTPELEDAGTLLECGDGKKGLGPLELLFLLLFFLCLGGDAPLLTRTSLLG